MWYGWNRKGVLVLYEFNNDVDTAFLSRIYLPWQIISNILIPDFVYAFFQYDVTVKC